MSNSLQPKDWHTRGSSVLHCLLGFAQIHVHWVMTLSYHLILCHSLIFSLYPIMMVSFPFHGYNRYANFQSLSTEWFFRLACSFPSASHLYSWGLHSKGYFLSKVFLDDPKRNWNEFTFFISSPILFFFMALVIICYVSSLVYWIDEQNILSKYIG